MAELGGISANLSPDPKGGFWEGRLTPYVQIGGINQYSAATRSNVHAPTGLLTGKFSPVRRFTLAVSPITTSTVPNSGEAKWMVNLDSEQLYTMAEDRVGVTYGPGYAFGKPWADPTPDLDAPCWEAYGTGDGAYTSPVPVQGLPIEFRKVYFRGLSVNEYGCTSGSGSGECATYYAYFPCSLPVKQTCASGTGASGITCNPRNETYGIMSGEVVPWSGFDIGCGEAGGGGGGCAIAYSEISGFGSSGVYSGSGCFSRLSFELSGCLTGENQVTGNIRQEPSGHTIVTLGFEPDIYQYVAVSGAEYPDPESCRASGCNGVIAFQTSGCLTGDNNYGESMFAASISCDSGNNTSLVTFAANPNIYASISGGGTVCTPSGCTGQIVFSATGCLTGNNKFRTIVECVEDDYGAPQYTRVTYEANPDIFSIISGSGTSVTASGCDAKIIFDTSGCPDFGVSVQEQYGEEGDAHVTFYLTGNACSGAAGSGITGTENIGDGSGIASGVVDNIAYFKSLIGGTNLQITGDEYGRSLILNVTGISGGGGSGITGTENIGDGSGIASGVVDNIAYFKSLIGGDNLEIVGDEYGQSLTFNVTGISGGSGGGGCTGFTSVTADGITSEPDSCGSGITFEATGCLGLEAEALYDGIKIKYGLCDTQILECLGYEEKYIAICEEGEVVTYTFLVKS